jgi:hypothetical protein
MKHSSLNSASCFHICGNGLLQELFSPVWKDSLVNVRLLLFELNSEYNFKFSKLIFTDNCQP